MNRDTEQNAASLLRQIISSSTQSAPLSIGQQHQLQAQSLYQHLMKQMRPPASQEEMANFRVIVRVRPPLPREITEPLDFMPVTSISPDNKQCTIQEYLGGELSEEGRQRDIVQ